MPSLKFQSNKRSEVLNTLYLLCSGLLLGLLVGGGVLLFMDGSNNPLAAILDRRREGPVVNKNVLSFELDTLSGEPLSVKDYHGKYVILNFWATWCGPCRFEMPALQNVFSENQSEVKVVAVNFNENPETVRAFVDELKLTFDVVLDPGAVVQEMYQVHSYPTTYFIDKEGIIYARHIGVLSESQILQNLSDMGLNK